MKKRPSCSHSADVAQAPFSLMAPQPTTSPSHPHHLRAGSPSRSPAGGGRRGGGDEFRRIQIAPLSAEYSRIPSHRFANEMGYQWTKRPRLWACRRARWTATGVSPGPGCTESWAAATRDLCRVGLDPPVWWFNLGQLPRARRHRQDNRLGAARAHHPGRSASLRRCAQRLARTIPPESRRGGLTHLARSPPRASA